jgi:TetR/AcrR family transcriptional repressor of nem operon
MTDQTVRDRILDAAEARARTGGYHGFSFRDLAEDIRVKSSSVHYHFPTKGDLGEALATRYADRARAYLGDPMEVTPKQAVDRLTALFRDALLRDDKMCLCGLFGAERDALPPNVTAATARFFRLILDYLEAAFGADWQGEKPAAIVSRLEGALILARIMEDPGLFEAGAT